MDIREMHKLFRVFGQQMGMQQVRAILPATIDILLNDAINTKVRTLLVENLGIDSQTRVVNQRDEITPINALSGLYVEETSTSESVEDTSKVLIYLGVAVKYNDETKRYSCRLIDSLQLETTLNDYCNGAYKQYPIATINNDIITIYTGSFNPTTITKIIKYIKNPAKVHYDELHEQSSEECTDVNCDVADYLHNDIVKIAVGNYLQSVGYTTPKSSNSNNNTN